MHEVEIIPVQICVELGGFDALGDGVGDSFDIGSLVLGGLLVEKILNLCSHEKCGSCVKRVGESEYDLAENASVGKSGIRNRFCTSRLPSTQIYLEIPAAEV